MLRHYAELIRIRKPAGFFLFLWPSIWGLTMAAYTYRLPITSYLLLLLKSTIAAFIIRSCACIINEIFDRERGASDIEAETEERTNKGPIASGDISVFSAILFLFAQFAIGITWFSTFRPNAFYLMVVQMIPMLCIYPLLKRTTRWPQIWLGFTINIGYVWSWLSIGDLSLFSFPLYTNLYMMGALWCWTMVYDTIYGCQDEEDDMTIGVRSTPMSIGSVIHASIFFAVVMVGLVFAAGVTSFHRETYFVFCIGGSSVFFIWKFATLDLNSEHSCWSFFIHNAFYLGFIVYVGLLVDYIRIIVGWY